VPCKRTISIIRVQTESDGLLFPDRNSLLECVFGVAKGLDVKKNIFVDEIRPEQKIQSVFLLISWESKLSRDSTPYLALKLGDRTGTIEGRAWKDASILETRLETTFVAIRAQAEEWNSQVTLSIEDLESVEDSQVDPSDFFETSRWTGDDLWDQLVALIREDVRSPVVRNFLLQILNSANLRAALVQAPAAMKNHHAYRGGLLEHILSMSRLALKICEHYQAYYPGLVDSDLVVAGCVLHDIAKCEELSFSGPTNYSTTGRLVGHIPLGSEWISNFAAWADPELPPDLILQLKHLVLSHHGKLEYGSPVPPLTPEALILHQIDMIDSRLNMVEALRPTEETAEEFWTPYQRSFDGPLCFRGATARSWEVKPNALALEGPGKTRDTSQVQNLDLFGDKK